MGEVSLLFSHVIAYIRNYVTYLRVYLELRGDRLLRFSLLLSEP